MSLVIKELIDGASATSKPKGITGLQWTRKRKWRVHNDGLPTTITQPEAIAVVGVSRGDTHPDDTSSLAKSVAVQPVTSSAGAVDVVWTYESSPFDGTTTPTEPQDLKGGIIASSVKALVMVKWREDPTIPANGVLPNSSMLDDTVDIGGEPIDVGGKGQSMFHMVQPLTVTIEVPAFPSMNMIRELLGTRNSDIFLGAPKGLVLYQGITSMTQTTGGSWKLVHQFLWDEVYHLRQFADRIVGENKVKTASGLTGDDEKYNGKAYKVWFAQPTPKLKPFSQLGITVRV